MEVLHAHCAGLDVHKDTVVACIRHIVDGKITTAVKTFKSTTQALEHFSFCYKVPCPIHSAFFCGMGGIPTKFRSTQFPRKL